jgi:hypothetical protein
MQRRVGMCVREMRARSLNVRKKSGEFQGRDFAEFRFDL